MLLGTPPNGVNSIAMPHLMVGLDIAASSKVNSGNEVGLTFNRASRLASRSVRP